MNKQKLFPWLAVLLLVTGMASAQLGQNGVKADIPFAFIAGSNSFPAGEYRVATVSDVGVLAVMGENSNSADVGLTCHSSQRERRGNQVDLPSLRRPLFLVSHLGCRGRSRT